MHVVDVILKVEDCDMTMYDLQLAMYDCQSDNYFPPTMTPTRQGKFVLRQKVWTTLVLTTLRMRWRLVLSQKSLGNWMTCELCHPFEEVFWLMRQTFNHG